MDMSLTDEQRAWQMKARKFAQEEIRPISLERDRIPGAKDTWDWEIIRKGSRLGFRTAVAPKAYGGHGIDYVTQALVMAELAKADSAISKAFSQCWKWSIFIEAACTPEQKARFFKPFIEDDTYVWGSANTEANSGCDNRMPPAEDPRAGYKLRAERHGNEWILNGEKTFIANGGVGKLFFIDCRTNPEVSIMEGTTIFVVTTDTPGFRFGRSFNKNGWRFYQNAELIFENARVPHENMVGELNGGQRARRGATAEFNEFELACNALGVCEDACESAVRHARTRKQGGQPLYEQQTVKLKLSEMHMLTEALRSFVLRTAWEFDSKMFDSPTFILLMNFSAEVITRVTELNMAVHAAAGVGMDAFADKLVRDGIIWTHLGGDNTQRMKALRRLPSADASERRLSHAVIESEPLTSD
jgi:alkylation response protein AidB-like acyl-CoA dehydrogenase